MNLVWSAETNSVVDKESDFCLKQTRFRSGEETFSVSREELKVDLYLTPLYECQFDPSRLGFAWKYSVLIGGTNVWSIFQARSSDDLVAKIEHALSVHLMSGAPPDLHFAIAELSQAQLPMVAD